MSLIRTPIVAFLDSDDIMHPQRIEIQTKFLISHELDICGTAMVEFNDDLDIVNFRRTREIFPSSGKFIDNPIDNPSLMMHTQVFFSVGRYKDIYCQGDYDFLIGAVYSGSKIQNLDVPLTAFRINSTLHDRRGGTKFIKSEYQIYQSRQNLDLPKFKEIILLALRLIFRLMPSKLRLIFWRRNQNLHGLQNQDLSSWKDIDLFNRPPGSAQK